LSWGVISRDPNRVVRALQQQMQQHQSHDRRATALVLASSVITPFEASLFDDGDENDPDNTNMNPYEPNGDNDNESSGPGRGGAGYGSSSSSPLAVPPDTRLVLGVNKYSHDTTLVAADAAMPCLG
jgi:hypothetical protein